MGPSCFDTAAPSDERQAPRPHPEEHACEWGSQTRTGVRASRRPHPEERALSAFTRVFDALWPASRRMRSARGPHASRRRP